MTDLRKAAEMALEAQPEQEPVAWMYEWDGRINFTTTDQRFVEAAHPHFVKSTPLYTAPPKQEWDGPTDEEYENFCSLIQREEAKLKEKNT
jgi:hypothetical protein